MGANTPGIQLAPNNYVHDQPKPWRAWHIDGIVERKLSLLDIVYNITSQNHVRKISPQSIASILKPILTLSLHIQHLVVESLVVGRLVQKSIERSSVSDLDLSNPTLLLGAGVDGLGVVLEDGVTADDLASNGGQHIGSRLDRLDGTDGLTGTDLEVGLGKLNKNNVTQRVGGVLGDTDLGYNFVLVVWSFMEAHSTIELPGNQLTNQCCCRQRARSIHATRCTSSPEL